MNEIKWVPINLDGVVGINSSSIKYYYSDKWQVLAEYDDSNTIKSCYFYGNYIDEALTMRKDGSTDYYYAHDHLYSPVGLYYNAASAVVERYEYDAYGRVTITFRPSAPL